MEQKSSEKITAALRSKPSGSDLPWEVEEELYWIVLLEIPESYSRALLRWVLLECPKYRPTTDEVFAWYMRESGQAGCRPDTVVGEIRRALERFGVYGMPDPLNPRCRVVGEPPLSPDARAVVEIYGGWFALCQIPIRNTDLFWREVREAAERVGRESVSQAIQGGSPGRIGGTATLPRLTREHTQRSDER